MAALQTSSREGEALKAVDVAELLREWAMMPCGGSRPQAL